MGISLGVSDLEFGNARALRDLRGRPPPLYLFYLPRMSIILQHRTTCGPPSKLRSTAWPTPNIMITLLEPWSSDMSKPAVPTNDESPTLTCLRQGTGVFIDPVSQALRSSRLAGGAPGSTMVIKALLIQELCRQVATGISAALSY